MDAIENTGKPYLDSRMQRALIGDPVFKEVGSCYKDINKYP
jgi:hypothetical protein